MGSDFKPDGPDEAAHLDAFRVTDDGAPEVSPDFEELTAEGELAAPPPPDVMPLDAWLEIWQLSWNMPGMIKPDLAPLSITPQKKPVSDAAAEAVYDIASNHFPWLIEARGGVFGAAMAIGPFAMIQIGCLRQAAADRRARERGLSAPKAEFEWMNEEAANGDAPPQSSVA